MFSDSTTERIVSRPYAGDADFLKVRRLLIDTYPLTPLDFNWEVRRWDGRRYHNADPAGDPAWFASIRLWETADGQLVGAAHHEGPGNAYLQLHPDYRYLETDMIAWAEDHLTAPDDDGPGRWIDFFVYDYDAPRQNLLAQRGYQKMPWRGVMRRLRFGQHPVPEVALAEGYTLRSTRPEEHDYAQVAAILNAAFNRTFHSAPEIRNFMTDSPAFRHDLDLVAETPEGVFASYVGITYEPVNGYAIFEPVCTHPDHLRLGLARSLMFEGLRRLKALGASEVMVGTGDAVAANQLYESIGFTEAYQGWVWRKTIE